MYRDGKGDDKNGKKGVGPHQPAPLRIGSPPPEREGPVEILPPPRDPVSYRRKVWNGAEVEEYHTRCHICADGKDVKHEWRLEARPDLTRGRVRHGPVEVPWTPHMDKNEDCGCQNGEEGHRLGAPVDGSAPRRLGNEKDCREECTGVADTNPEDEVCQVDAPQVGLVKARHPLTDIDLVAPRHNPEQDHPKPHQNHEGVVAATRLGHRPDDVVVNLFVGNILSHNRSTIPLFT